MAVCLISLCFGTLLIQESGSGLIVMAARPSPGTCELDIYGDASGLYSFCEMFQHFSVMKLEWSVSVPIYPDGYMNIALDVGDLDFDKANDWMYHLSLRGLKEGSIISAGYMSYTFSVKARSADLDLLFSDRTDYYPYYYRTLDMTGTLRGDVLLHIDVPGIPNFYYEGSELTIHVHISTRLTPRS